MNTLEFDTAIISIILIGIFSFSELSFISVWCVSFKCCRNSSSLMLLRL